MSVSLSPQSLCIIHRKALCTVVQNSGGDVTVAASVAPDCHLGWIHATGENAHLFVCSALLVLPKATADGQGSDVKRVRDKSIIFLEI